MKIRASTKIAIGTAAIGACGFFGYQYFSGLLLGNTNFPDLIPGDVNIIGIDPGSGYRIRVVNQVAQLIEGKQFEFGESDNGTEGPTSGADAKRIPIRDLLETLKGNERALGHFVMVMNDRQENENWPPERNIWLAADVEKALNGDPVLQKKLEQDINMKLDGTPLSQFRMKSYENGIIVESIVPIDVMVGQQRRTLRGPIQTPYRPSIMGAVEREIREKSEVTPQTIAGYYSQFAQDILSGKAPKENVRGALKRLIDPRSLSKLAEAPQRVLDSARVLVNDALIENARYDTDQIGKDTLYNITLDLRDEGRRRLWAYSRGRVGAQLLLTSNGVAIAAPRIKHELVQSELTITQMRDKSLLDDMIETLRSKGVGKPN